MDVTLTQLQYVVTVADVGSFFGAAERCHVTQPTLSQQIKKLEDHLGVVIFDRSRKPVKPTTAGTAVIAQARRVLSESHVLKGLASSRSTLQGEVKIAIIPTLAPFILPPMVRSLHRRYPKLKLQIEELQTDTIISRLIQSESDVGVLVTPLHQPRLKEQPIFYEPFYLYFSAGHPIGSKKAVQPRDLNRDEIHLLADGHCFRVQTLELCAGKKKPKGDSTSYLDFASGSLQTLKEMVDVVGGYTLLPWLARQELLSARERERVRPFQNPAPVREISVVTRLHEPNTEAAAEAVGTAIRQSLPAELAAIGPGTEVIPID